MDNTPARQAVIDRMQDIVRRDAPWVFGFHPKNFALYHRWLANLKPNLMANNTVKYLRLDPELRADLRARWNRPLWWPLAVLALGLVLAIVPAWRRYRQRMEATAL